MNKKTKYLLMTLIAIIIILILTIIITPPRNIDEPEYLPTIAEKCEISGGNWLADYSECEMINKEWCEENGGTFNECASACRHDSEAEICTLQCVFVCEFN